MKINLNSLPKLFILIVFLLQSTFAIAQSLQGEVYDENNKPLGGVSVYIDGTSMGTSTDKSGRYQILYNYKINSALVFRMLGYENYYISKPFENNNLRVVMRIKSEELQEVTVTKELFSRKEKLALFRWMFLGFTKAGLSCRILNEDDISFVYDYNKNSMIATADKPLMIHNDYLGYLITFDLHIFKIEFRKKSIDSHDVHRSIFLGTTSFKEISADHLNLKRRNEAYLGSSKHFFKNLIDNTWSSEEFILFKNRIQTNTTIHFNIEEVMDAKKVTIKEKAINGTFCKDLDVEFCSDFDFVFNKMYQSKIIFYTPTFVVDNFGNTSNVDQIEFSGRIAVKKAGDMLPLDFIPINK